MEKLFEKIFSPPSSLCGLGSIEFRLKLGNNGRVRKVARIFVSTEDGNELS